MNQNLDYAIKLAQRTFRQMEEVSASEVNDFMNRFIMTALASELPTFVWPSGGWDVDSLDYDMRAGRYVRIIFSNLDGELYQYDMKTGEFTKVSEEL